MKAKRSRQKGKRRRSRAAIVLAGTLAATPAATAAASVPEITDQAISKLSAGALRRLLVNLRQDEQKSGGATALKVAADHDSHVMFGSHSSHGSHGQHTSHSSSS